ncbi:unnamed protein product [Caenorhabditis angaria]|uniref:Suppressor of Ty 6 homolog n=1 Tax=Caenorhabditis angaria TaxID=860376 RepID=A0A9P1IHW1_9PELO|nr:unnamed protein product [Caenorhabditis angaria]
MDFLDNQAEESEGDSSVASGSDDEPRKKKMKLKEKGKKSGKKRVVESSDEDDDEDDEEEGRKEMAGFIADEDEDEDDAKSEKSGKKSDEEVDDDLDDDDLDLINENLDIQSSRTHKPRVELDSDDENDQERIGREIFQSRGEEEERSERGSGDDRRRYSDSDSEHSDNFIEEDDENARRRHRKRRKHDETMPEGAEDDARDVFGVEDFNFDEFYDDDEDGLDDEEEEEIIEDDGDGGEIKIRRKKDPSKKSTLLEAIEPSELDRGFLSAADKKIQMEDAPERFLLRKTPVTECDDEELEKEAKWIFKYAFDTDSAMNQTSTHDYDKLACLLNLDSDQTDQKRAEVVNSIREVLRFIRVKATSFEVPFIAFYRKEYIDQTLNLNNLWKVYEYDEKWCHLVERKQKMSELIRRMRHYQENADDVLAARRMISEMDIIDVNYAETMEQLTDMHANFQLLYGASIESMVQWEKNKKLEDGEEEEDYKARFKASIRNDRYQMCVENGIGELAGRFGLTAKQFAENLDWKKHEVEQDEELPLDAAENYVCSSFPDREMVLAGAKFMLAKEISRQPAVRERVRREFRHSAKVWARVTRKGRDTFDETHPMWDKRYISEKPISQLEDEEFLQYHKMKEEGFMEFRLDCDNGENEETNSGDTLTDRLLSNQPFTRDEYTQIVEEWNNVRDECVRQAIDQMILPYMRTELYNTLLEEAKDCVAKKCRKEFAERISYSGFVPTKSRDEDENEDDEDRHGEIRIMSIVYPTGNHDDASFGVMIDENGVVVDYLRMVHFTKRATHKGATAELKNQSMDLFKKFVQRRRPHAIGINIENMECQRLKKDVELAIDDLVGEGLIIRRPAVILMDNEPAKIYMNSKQSVAEFPDYPPILRQAVSLARLMLDPLTEYTHLWNADEDIFCLSLHPMQRDIEQDHLTKYLLHEVVNRVNELGVDINKCVEYTHYMNMLQFVCGLGPRKAASLLKTIRLNENLIESRTKLVTMCKLGPKVFMNCAGFIRIDTEKVTDRTDAYVEILDGSRVHPETYEWARKMAVDALEVDDSADPTTALMEIMEAPDRLKDLDLDAFAEELNRQGFGEKKATLYDISAELSARYKDLREPFQEPDGDKLYHLLCRSGKEIKEGQKIMGTVFSVQYKRNDRNENEPLPETDMNGMFSCPYCKQFTSVLPGDIQEHMSKDDRDGGCPGTAVGIRVRFDNGMIGFCANKNISKDHIDNPLSRVKLNQPYWFKVLNVNRERMSFFLSCKSSDLASTDSGNRDRYWDSNMYEIDQTEIEAEALKKRNVDKRVKRVISHPNFQNVSYEAATKLLDSKDWSECIIRPSAHKDTSLSVTWKICNGVYHNFFVKESDKDQAFTIGRSLRVGNEEFEDLNELIARFVQPMIQISHEITTHKYFCEEATCEDIMNVEEFCREKRRELGRNAYVFSASIRKPCQFCISYMFDNSGRIRHEYFNIHPHGIRFRNQNFESLDYMMAWFKKHFNERPLNAPSSSRHQSHHQQQYSGSQQHYQHHSSQPQYDQQYSSYGSSSATSSYPPPPPSHQQYYAM